MKPVKVLVLDSTGDGRSIAQLLQAEGDIESIIAERPHDAAVEMNMHAPDVVVLVPNSEAGALDAIGKIMGRRPVPILLLSERGFPRVSMLHAGALDVMALAELDTDRAAAIRRRIRSISEIQLARDGSQGHPHASSHRLAVVGIAASTGGPQAVATVLAGLDYLPAAILVVQHIHPDFIGGFQTWMDRECPLPVTFATDGLPLKRGRVYIAPANLHLKMAPGRKVALDPEPELLHRPSADILFESIAEQAGPKGVGVLLTGMGDDGVQGLLAIRRSGGRTIAQDEQSSAVFGMPRAAAQAGAAERVVPLDKIAGAIIDAVAARI